MSLRPYQERLVTEVLADLETSKEVLLAACPGAGKTEMALAIVERLPGLRVLVLAHGTDILRTNFSRRLEKKAPHLMTRVRVALPQEHRSIKAKYDLVIVDEAHEFYDVEDGMVQKIIKKVGAKKTLLLTGSPSGFIARGLTPHAFSLEELNREGAGQWNADLLIELGTSAYDIREKDYVNEEVRTSFKYTSSATKKTLDDLLGTLTERLKLGPKGWSGWNKLVYKTVEAGWNKVLSGIKKTIIACRSIEMANQVGEYFQSKGIKCLVSHSKVEDERNSANIHEFQTNKDVTLLIVVDRAQLGFDFDRLVNFVDMTGSKNPNRIFQMMCRVVRTPQDEKPWAKLFVKVMPAEFSPVRLRWFMSGVLTLAQQWFFSTWDGKGFMRIDVPVKRKSLGERKPGEDKGDVPEQGEPFLERRMMMFGDYFKGLAAKYENGYEPIAYVKLGETLGGYQNQRDSTETKPLIFDFYERHGRLPKEFGSGRDTEERYLGGVITRFGYPSAPYYDSVFAARVNELRRESPATTTKGLILDFYARKGWLPRQHVPDREEHRLAGRMQSYCSEKKETFDPVFMARLLTLDYGKERFDRSNQREKDKEAILKFARSMGELPRKARSGKMTSGDELRLAQRMIAFTWKKSDTYDPAFEKKVSAFGHRNRLKRNKVIRSSDGRTWLSARAAARAVGVSMTGLSKAARGIKKSAAGYTWRYLTEEEAADWRAAGCPETMDFAKKAA